MLIVVQHPSSFSANAALNSALTFAAFEQDLTLLFLASAFQCLSNTSVSKKLTELAELTTNSIFVETSPEQLSEHIAQAQLNIKPVNTEEVKALLRSATSITSY